MLWQRLLYSGEMVRQNKKVILTILSDKIADVVMGCGISTGRNTDKIKKFGVKMKVLPTAIFPYPNTVRLQSFAD